MQRGKCSFVTFALSLQVASKRGKFTWQIHLFCSKLLANRIDKFRRKSTDSAALHGRMLRVLDGSTTLRKLRKSGVRGKWFMPKFTRLVDRTTCGVHGYMGIWGSVDLWIWRGYSGRSLRVQASFAFPMASGQQRGGCPGGVAHRWETDLTNARNYKKSLLMIWALDFIQKLAHIISDFDDSCFFLV